ncbi:MAG: MgtC/SapB family protein [Janthinobacterium lividum]
MHAMPLIVDWKDLAWRLALTLLAGALVGLNRDEHGRPAGLRTTMLVCLAASVAMIQANLLLPTAGRSNDSFITLDLMRLPLGILSGVGFLGAGAILRRSNRIVGVTTAATLWIVTVIGLCFGGGQLLLGSAATVLALAVLWGLKFIEPYIQQERRATLVLEARDHGTANAALLEGLSAAQIHITGQSVAYSDEAARSEITYDLRWRGRRGDILPPDFLKELAASPGVSKLQWQPQSLSGV